MYFRGIISLFGEIILPYLFLLICCKDFCNETGCLGDAIWAPAVWAQATQTLAINPASILSKRYFNQSNYYARRHHFHSTAHNYQARILLMNLTSTSVN